MFSSYFILWLRLRLNCCFFLSLRSRKKLARSSQSISTCHNLIFWPKSAQLFLGSWQSNILLLQRIDLFLISMKSFGLFTLTKKSFKIKSSKIYRCDELKIPKFVNHVAVVRSKILFFLAINSFLITSFWDIFLLLEIAVGSSTRIIGDDGYDLKDIDHLNQQYLTILLSFSIENSSNSRITRAWKRPPVWWFASNFDL